MGNMFYISRDNKKDAFAFINSQTDIKYATDKKNWNERMVVFAIVIYVLCYIWARK